MTLFVTEQSGLLNAKKAFEVLEPCAGKLASTVLRGRSGSNATLLPDFQWADGRHNMWVRGKRSCGNVMSHRAYEYVQKSQVSYKGKLPRILKLFV